MAIHSDIFNEFSNTNPGGSTFTRTINLVTPASLDVLVSFATLGDYGSDLEFVQVNIEGFDLGPFLDRNPDNDQFLNLNDPLDDGDDGATTFLGVATIPASAWASITADGKIEITYTLGPDVGNLLAAQEFLAISFNDSPAAPVGESYAITEDAPLIVGPAGGLLANDGAPIGALVLLDKGPQNGVLTIDADGSFQYTPFGNFSGVDSFTYRIVDGVNISNPGTVTLTVASDNDAPVLLGTFKINDLLTTNSAVIDHEALTGDDRGGIAISGTQVFVTGDDATARFGLDLTGGVALPAPEYDGLVSDLATGAVYVLGTSATAALINDGTVQTITHLLAVDGATGALTGASIALSSAIAIDTDFSLNGVFSGAGRAVIFSVNPEGRELPGTVYDIDFSTGAVALRPSIALPDLGGSENWADWGVAEEFGGELYLAYATFNDSIERIRVSDGTITTIAQFDDVEGMASFTVSPTNNRWYFHHENASQFGGTDEEPDETLGYADALLDVQKLWDDATFAENAVNSAAQLIDSDMSLVDPDSDFAGGKITVAYASGDGFEDMLSIRNQGNGAGQIGFDGVNVSFGGSVIGTVTSNGAHGEDLVVTFQTGASVAAVEALLENLTYKNTSDAPATSRTLSIVLDDGDGGVSAPVTSTITITAEDDPAGVVIVGTKKNDTVDVDDTVNGQALPTNFADQISGGKGKDKLSGLGGNDTIDGGKDKDTLRGGDGDDLLSGGKDKDKLFGEAGEDSFLFNTKLKKQGNENVDKLKDFSAFDDLILLDDKVFKELAPGGLSVEAFAVGKKAKTDGQHIIYNDKNGELLYDADGKGGDKAIAFAKVQADLTHLDFFVV